MWRVKFRKKPIVVEAEQWFPGSVIDEVKLKDPIGPVWYIETLEGKMRVSPGDWIITGVIGEKYSCKPDIFAATYEEVGEEKPAQPSSRTDILYQRYLESRGQMDAVLDEYTRMHWTVRATREKDVERAHDDIERLNWVEEKADYRLMDIRGLLNNETIGSGTVREAIDELRKRQRR